MIDVIFALGCSGNASGPVLLQGWMGGWLVNTVACLLFLCLCCMEVLVHLFFLPLDPFLRGDFFKLCSSLAAEVGLSGPGHAVVLIPSCP